MPAFNGGEFEEEVRVGLDEPGRIHGELVGEVRERRVGVDLHAQGADDGVLDDYGLLGAGERLALGAVALLAVVGHPVEIAAGGGSADPRRLHGAAGDDLEREGVGRAAVGVGRALALGVHAEEGRIGGEHRAGKEPVDGVELVLHLDAVMRAGVEEARAASAQHERHHVARADMRGDGRETCLVGETWPVERAGEVARAHDHAARGFVLFAGAFGCDAAACGGGHCGCGVPQKVSSVHSHLLLHLVERCKYSKRRAARGPKIW